MKQISLLSIFLMLFTLSGCELAGDIFSAGFYTGLILVVGVVILAVWLFGKRR